MSDTRPPPPRRRGKTDRRRRFRRLIHVALDRTEPLVEWLIRLCGWSAILFVFAIFFFVFREAAPMLFGKLNLVEFFTSTELAADLRGPVRSTASWPCWSARSSVTGAGHGAGRAAGAWARRSTSPSSARGKIKETLKILIELLAAIPSVVWGFIGYMVLGPVIIELTGAPVGVNLLNGGIILALMSVPIIVSVGEDALKAVPDSYREAALSLGASRWEIVYRVLFPGGEERAAGGRAAGRRPGDRRDDGRADGHRPRRADPAQPARSRSARSRPRSPPNWARRSQGDDHYRVLFVIGLVLFAVTFVVNLTADLVVKGIRSEKPLNSPTIAAYFVAVVCADRATARRGSRAFARWKRRCGDRACSSRGSGRSRRPAADRRSLRSAASRASRRASRVSVLRQCAGDGAGGDGTRIAPVVGHADGRRRNACVASGRRTRPGPGTAHPPFASRGVHRLVRWKSGRRSRRRSPSTSSGR